MSTRCPDMFNRRQMHEYAVRVGEAVLRAAKQSARVRRGPYEAADRVDISVVDVRSIASSTSTYGAGW